MFYFSKIIKKRRVFKSILIGCILVFETCSSPEKKDEICLNQIGFYPQSRKIAVLKSFDLQPYVIISVITGDTVYQNRPEKAKKSPFSESTYRTILNFTDFTQKGTFYIKMGHVCSPQFVVSDTILSPILKATQKAFYYNRAGMELKPEYAGIWSRKMAHPDTNVYVHPSAASLSRKANTIISAPKGWYGAGDYNKYVSSTNFSLGLTLNIYESYKMYFDTLDLSLPKEVEGSALWNEIYYGLQWLQSMQDNDGGVYHKLTSPHYEAFIAPDQCSQKRYVMAKSVTATLGFAAVMAQAARLDPKNNEWLSAAKKAFDWSLNHKTLFYLQNEINELYKPIIMTNPYEDDIVNDDFFWASIELFLTTNDAKYLKYIYEYKPVRYFAPLWNKVYALGYFSILQHPNAAFKELMLSMNESLIEDCNQLLTYIDQSPFAAPFGHAEWCFHFGAIPEECCGGAISLLHAYKQTYDTKYLDAAVDNLDYILGRNATGYCFVTGFGSKQVMSPHHRLSYSYSCQSPIPGLLVGGPNIGQDDKTNCGGYSSNVPDESYVDNSASFASNQPAIHWNAELLYAVSLMDILMRQKK